MAKKLPRHKCKNCGHDLKQRRGLYGHRYIPEVDWHPEKQVRVCPEVGCDCETPEKQIEEPTNRFIEYDSDGSPY